MRLLRRVKGLTIPVTEGERESQIKRKCGKIDEKKKKKKQIKVGLKQDDNSGKNAFKLCIRKFRLKSKVSIK